MLHADWWHEADTSLDEADTILEELEHGDSVIVSRAGAGAPMTAPHSNIVADLALSPLRAGVCVCVCVCLSGYAQVRAGLYSQKSFVVSFM